MNKESAMPGTTKERVRLLVAVLEAVEEGNRQGHDVSALQAYARDLIEAGQEVGA